MRVGSEGLETAFDVFPAYAPTPALAKSKFPLYVFRFRQPDGWPDERQAQRWVLWDVARDGVVLTDEPQELCFVRMIRPKKVEDASAFSIVLEDPEAKTGRRKSLGQLKELLLMASGIEQEDFFIGEFDTPEVSFGKHFSNRKQDGRHRNRESMKYNIFCLE